jgi:hypothetical protein
MTTLATLQKFPNVFKRIDQLIHKFSQNDYPDFKLPQRATLSLGNPDR